MLIRVGYFGYSSIFDFKLCNHFVIIVNCEVIFLFQMFNFCCVPFKWLFGISPLRVKIKFIPLRKIPSKKRSNEQPRNKKASLPQVSKLIITLESDCSSFHTAIKERNWKLIRDQVEDWNQFEKSLLFLEFQKQAQVRGCTEVQHHSNVR